MSICLPLYQGVSQIKTVIKGTKPDNQKVTKKYSHALKYCTKISKEKRFYTQRLIVYSSNRIIDDSLKQHEYVKKISRYLPDFCHI